MDEILALQAQLAKAQLAETAHRISERTAVDLVLKLIELKKVQLLFSKSGREYVTPAQVVEEVEMALLSAGGRVTLVDLAPQLSLDLGAIETAARTLTSRKRNVVELAGQLIASYYLDGVVEELNESLQSSGSADIVAAAQRFNLPADFMRSAIEQRLGTQVQGYIEEGQVYTATFLQLHESRTRGAFRALTRPTPLRSVIQRHGLMATRVAKEVAALIKKGDLNGSLKGVDDRAVYTPALFLRAQQSGVESFFSTNGYIQYSKLERLAISNPKQFISTHFPSALQLASIALSEAIVGSVVLSCEDAAAANLFCNASSILPNVLSRDEVEQVLQHAIKAANKNVAAAGGDKQQDKSLFILNEVWAVSSQFRATAQAHLLRETERFMDDEELKLAQAAAAAAEAASNAPVAAMPAKPAARAAAPVSDDESDEEEKGRKGKGKAKKGKANRNDSDDEDDAPAASKGKKKRGGKRGAADSDDDEPAPAAAPAKSSKSKAKTSAGIASVPPLTKDRVLKWLKAGWSAVVKEAQAGSAEMQAADSIGDESTDELIGALATLLHPACLVLQKQRNAARAAALAAAAANAAPSASSSAGGVSLGVSDAVVRRQQLECFRTAIQDQYETVVMYQHAIEYVSGTGGDEAAKAPAVRADKSFVQLLESHLHKTLSAGLLDLLVRMEAFASLSPAQQSSLPGLDQLVVPAAANSSADSKEEKDASVKPRFDLNRSPLQAKDRDAIVAALPRRSQEVLRNLCDVWSKESSASPLLDRLESQFKSLDLNLKKLDKKSERSRVFAVRKTLMGALAGESKAPVVLQLVLLLLFAKVHGVVLHAPARLMQPLRRMIKPELQPAAYAKLRRFQQLALRELRGDQPDESPSSSSGAMLGGASDSEDEERDDTLPPESQIKAMSIEAVRNELAASMEAIRAFGMDCNTAVRDTKGK